MRTTEANIQIRNFHPTDLPYLYKICLKTADSGKDATQLYKDPFLVGQYFAAPYANFEPDLTFILTLNEKPYGYILGTSDTINYYKWLNKYWLPILRKRYKIPEQNDKTKDANIIRLIHNESYLKNELSDYPAHLHINLLPEPQGMGMGKKLIYTFITKLKQLHIIGLHLEVGKTNTGAIQFYERVGFKVIKEYDKSIAYGMKL